MKINTANEQLAFKVLFDTWYEALCSYAVQYLRDPDEAEEVVQDVFVRIWQKRQQYALDQGMKGYLFQSVRNACLNLLKHRKVIRMYESETRQQTPEGVDHDPIEIDELQEKISTVVESLPTERKRIFLLSRNEGRKYQEIADELNISVKTVENQMGKALKTLREALHAYLPIILLLVSLVYLLWKIGVSQWLVV